VDEEHLAVARQLFFNCAADQRFSKGSDDGLNREAILRRRFDHTHVAQTDQ